MKNNYFLITLVLALFVNATSIKATEFPFKSQISKVRAVTPATETFYKQLTSLPFEPTDSVDMTNSTSAPSIFFPTYSQSYPTIGYKVILATPGTITLNAASSTISTNSYAFMVTLHYDLSDYVHISIGNSTTKSLSAGTYYIALFTDQRYGNFKISITSTASTTSGLENAEDNQVQLYGENNTIIAKGLSPKSVVNVYDTHGQLLKSTVASSQTEEIAMPNKGIYIVRVNGLSKIIIL